MMRIYRYKNNFCKLDWLNPENSIWKIEEDKRKFNLTRMQ